MTQYKFHLNNLRIAPRKVRLVANLVKRSPLLLAEAQLKFQSKRAALPILKLLKSARMSAANNFNLLPENLYISNILVDEGVKLKRFRARAFGRAGAIHKKTSHITLVVEERTGLIKKPKIAVREIKKEEIIKEVPKARHIEKIGASAKAAEVIKPKGKFEGITRKIFRRKAIG